jgi:type I restriction enzyme S subunit
MAREAPVGNVAMVPQGLYPCLGQRTLLIRPNPELVSPRYLTYLLIGDEVQGIIHGLTNGVTVPHLNMEDVRSLPLPPLPSLPTQCKIASLLSAYDDLIENNTRRIAVLEAMAEAIYREWFVEFRFPGHEKLKFVDSPLGKIPTGWQVVRLDSLKADQPYAIIGGPFGSNLGTKDYTENGVPVIRGTNLSETGRFRPDDFVFVSEEKAEELRANLARPGDIVVTQRGTLGQLGMIPYNIGYDRFIISQSQMKVTLSDVKAKREYVFYVLRSSDANTRIKNLAVSSGVPHINLGTLRDFEIVLPPLWMQQRFADFAAVAEEGIELNMKRIRNLRTTRDLLLPKLISGQLDVEDLDIETAEAVAMTE